MARTTNYDNRRVSLSIYSQSFNYQSDLPQSVETTMNGEAGGFICAGIAKLCQSVLVFLLSDDIIFDGTWGTSLPRYLNYSVQVLGQDIESIMEAAFAETIRELRKNERSGAPDDERINTITLKNWDYTPDGTGITMTLQVTSVAGDGRNLVIPLNLTV